MVWQYRSKLIRWFIKISKIYTTNETKDKIDYTNLHTSI